MRMVERHRADGFGKGRTEIEARVVRQQGAGNDGRPCRALEFDDHARTRAHDALGRLAEYAPACLGDFGYIGAGVHLRKDRQRLRVLRIEREPYFVEETRKTLT